MVVCECTGVTAAKIRKTAEAGATTVSEVTRATGAGGCCQSCRPAISRILRRVAAEKEAARIEAARADATVAEPATA